MRSTNIAFALNFFLPGAGFAYLGKWALGAVNLLGALGIGVVLALLLPESFLESYGHYVAIGIASGSGALALVKAEEMNAEAERGPSEEEVAETLELP